MVNYILNQMFLKKLNKPRFIVYINWFSQNGIINISITKQFQMILINI